MLIPHQSIPPFYTPNECKTDHLACLDSLGDRCVAVAIERGPRARLYFLHSELMNEIASISLPTVPSGMVFHRNRLFLMVKGSLLVSEVSLSTLSLKDVIRHTVKPLAHVSKRLHVDSEVRLVSQTVIELPLGIRESDEWAKYITKSEEFSKEEEAVLKESNENFEAKALEFISSRVEANNSVISLSNLFLKRLIQRCILPGHKILSSVLQKLIRSGVDISVNPNILPAILDSRDLVTLLFYLQFASFISEPDLIKIWKYCLCANKFMVLQFAQDCKLTEKKHYKIRRR